MQFSRSQRDLAIRAMDEAEERTIGYYCIPPYRWHRLQYDLVTQQDHEWEPLPESALARLQLLSRLRPSRETVGDFYRIQLNDPSILNAARRESLELDLYPFLVYILTHEMVHLVRLSTILPEGQEAEVAAEAEESRVHVVSRRILSRMPDTRLAHILSRFAQAPLTIDCPCL